jgi:hypothetical protein
MHELTRARAALALVAALATTLLTTLLTPPAQAVTVVRSTKVLQRVLVGTSVQGRPIYAYRKGNPQAANRVLVIGQIHGNEDAGVTTAWRMINYTPVSLAADVWVIPTMNPDGRAHGTRTNAHRVDLNRNFPQNWKRDGAGGCCYSGPTAASEPETKALMAFLDRYQPQEVVTIHQPYGVVAISYGDVALSQRLSRNLHLPLADVPLSGPVLVTQIPDPLPDPGPGAPSLGSWYTHTHPGTVAPLVEYSKTASYAYAKWAAVPMLQALGAY